MGNMMMMMMINRGTSSSVKILLCRRALLHKMSALPAVQWCNQRAVAALVLDINSSGEVGLVKSILLK
jgi:hypothetical protein